MSILYIYYGIHHDMKKNVFEFFIRSAHPGPSTNLISVHVFPIAAGMVHRQPQGLHRIMPTSMKSPTAIFSNDKGVAVEDFMDVGNILGKC